MNHNTYSPESLRTVAWVGHGGAGKTTLIEALLAQAGAIHQAGSVEKGNTVCDYDSQEKQHLHSVKVAVAHLEHNSTRVHMLDTPGYPDFMGQAVWALDAVETVVVVIDATKGIELTTRRMMHWAQTRGLCRMIVVHKIDAAGIDVAALLDDIQTSFGRECLPINVPHLETQQVVDCIAQREGQVGPWNVAQVHQQLLDQVVEMDEELMNDYLEQGDVEPKRLHAPFEAALRSGHLVPICFASAFSGAGVPQLLDSLVKLLPNPAEGNLPAFVKGEGDEAIPFHALPDASLHVIAHVFKIEIDPYVGKTAYARVYQGTMRQGMQLFVGDSRKGFKVAHLFHVQGKQLTEVDQAMPGDIVALTKVEELAFDAVLHDAGEDDHVHMKSLDIPHAVLGLAIKPKKQSDTSKLAEVLHKLTAEDAGLHVEHDPNTHEAVIRGLGEMHLESVLERIREQFHLDIESHPPTIPYRETLSKPAEGHHRHKKQSGGAGQFGEVFLRVEPLERGAGFEFVDAVKGGVIPGVFIPAVEKGVREAMATGMVAGFPMQDVRVTVYDGKTHAVDGKEIAFVSAGKKAMREAAMQAAPVILEPIVNIEVTAPEHCFGDISGDLSWRRGQITGSDSGRGGMMSIKAIVPLAELENYQPRLKSMTGGQGVYTLELSHYEQVPSEVQRKLSAGFKLQQEED